MIAVGTNWHATKALDRVPENPDSETGLYLHNWLKLKPKPVGSATFSYTPQPGLIGPTSWTTGENPSASAGSQWHDFSGGHLAGSGSSKSPFLVLGIGAAIFLFIMKGKLLR